MYVRTVLGTCLLALSALAPCAAAQESPRSDGAAPSDSSRLLDVPFVAQREALCGGAAAAMVLRYWGDTAVLAEDFASLVDETAEGIKVSQLSRGIANRGWRATSFTGSAVDVKEHLARGRPVVALIEDRPGRYHYVVIVAWTRDRVVVHDPAKAPFRVVSRMEFEHAWTQTGRTTLLILPPAEGSNMPGSIPLKPEGVRDHCFSPLGEATRRAQSGDLSNAEALLELIVDECPGPARRELAGIRFLQKRWEDVERLAADATARDPFDMQAWQLIAAARFLQGDATGALDAWNRREEPRVDLARIQGLDRVRHEVVADVLELAPGELLTAHKLARASRRVAAMPGIQVSRVGFRPRADGRATIDVGVLEKPAAPRKWPSVAAMSVHATVAREVRVDTANLAGDGELWNASWRWWADRPRVALGLATPRLWRANGVWRIEVAWERQPYRQASSDGLDAVFHLSQRRSARLSYGDWATGNLRWNVSGGLDRWADRGSHSFAGAAVERRWWEDRIALRADGTFWHPLGRRANSFARSGVSAAWRSSSQPGPTWTGSVGVTAASASAPLDLWPMADTGQVGSILLRAHPLLENGAIRTSDVSRLLAHATLEFQRPVVMRLPARVWWAAFVDTAKRGAAAEHLVGAALIDVGVGLRLQLPGTPNLLRLDLARGARDGRMAFSAGWQTTWSGR